MLPGSRRSFPLVLAAALSCTGRMDAPQAPAPAAPPPAGAPAEAPAPDPADTLAATLTEDKLKRLLLFEEEILPVSAAIVQLASAPGATGAGGSRGEPSREERQRALDDRIAAALQKHGLTRADHQGFGAIAGGLVERSAKAAEARELLAKDAERRSAPARAPAEAARRTKAAAPAPSAVAKEGRPLPEPLVQQLQTQIVQADADRKAFAARNGQAVLDLLDRYRPQILALREQQVRVVLGASSAR
jgi:hypothetical protein